MDTTVSLIIIAVTTVFWVVWLYAKLLRLESECDRLFEEINTYWAQLEKLGSRVNEIRDALNTKAGVVHLDDEMEALIAEKRRQYTEQIQQALKRELEFFEES